MPIPNYGDKYDSPALFSVADAIDGQGGDSEAELPKAIIITYQHDFFEGICAERTVEHADIVLPASSWVEKEGTVTNTDRQVQRMRPTASPPGNARADLDILGELGRRLMRATGNEELEGAFRYDGSAAVFEELRQLTPQYAGMRYRAFAEGSQRWPFPEGPRKVSVSSIGTSSRTETDAHR